MRSESIHILRNGHSFASGRRVRKSRSVGSVGSCILALAFFNLVALAQSAEVDAATFVQPGASSSAARAWFRERALGSFANTARTTIEDAVGSQHAARESIRISPRSDIAAKLGAARLHGVRISSGSRRFGRNGFPTNNW